MRNIIWLIVLAFSMESYSQSKTVSPFPLSSVSLLEGPFYHAQQTDLKYILALDPERLLAPFLMDAGIETKAIRYENWENTGLDGHIGGHYLSALSLMYVATGNQEVLQRLNYMMKRLAECQKKNGNGYVGGIPGGQPMWQEIAEGKIDADNFSLNKKWVPLYNIHKLFAGLHDAYAIAGNKEALDILTNLCDWFITTTSGLSEEQLQQMLQSEHGGLNEVFAEVAAITGDEKFMEMAKKLSHKMILNPLIDKKDKLTGLHANTQIPKVVGFKRIADISNNKSWSDAADFFWQAIVTNRSVSIGGNSVREHFHPANDFSSMIESNQGPETCNTYNMLRLTKLLYFSDPASKYMDYYERALYNHILSSQHPEHGGLVYFTPMRPRHYRVYSNPQETFWCCVGSGLENHGKYGELIYAHNEKDVFVNLFIPSKLNWVDKGLTLSQKTDFPFAETSVLTLDLKEPMKFTMNIRNPGWVFPDKVRLSVNGMEINHEGSSKPFISIDRTWKKGDVITITIPMCTKIEYLPSDSSWASFIHGPIVLAAATDSTDLTGLVADDSRMGHVAEGKFYPIEEAPMMVSRSNNILPAIKKVPGKALTFSAASLIFPAQYQNIKLVPFFTVHDARYMIYWQITSPEELETIKEDLRIKEKDKLALEERTVDQVSVGEQQPEAEHHFQGISTESGSTNGKTWRASRGWFSYEFKNWDSEGVLLRIVHSGGGRNRKFDLIVNDQVVKTIILGDEQNDNTVFMDVEVPMNLLKNSKTNTLSVKLGAHENSTTGRIYEIRLLKNQ